jgi:hypothetical protein
LAAGDFTLAGKILWLGLQLEWQKGIAFLEDQWASFKEFFLNLASQAFYGATSLLIDAWAGLQSVWIDTTAFLADAWSNFTSGLVTGWRTAQTFISQGVLRLMKLFDSSLDVEGASQLLDQQFQQSQSAAQQQRQRSQQEREWPTRSEPSARSAAPAINERPKPRSTGRKRSSTNRSPKRPSGSANSMLRDQAAN